MFCSFHRQAIPIKVYQTGHCSNLRAVFQTSELKGSSASNEYVEPLHSNFKTMVMFLFKVI